MTDQCPNCGLPYSTTVNVEMGDRYEDVFGRPLSSLLSDFVRICPDVGAARQASQRANVDVEVYLHRPRDLEQQGRMSD